MGRFSFPPAGPTGPVGPASARRILIFGDTVGEGDILPIDRAPSGASWTVSEITGAIVGAPTSGGPSMQLRLQRGPDPNGAGVDLVNGGVLVDGPVVVNTLDVSTLAPGDWLWVVVDAITGYVEAVNIGITLS